jgi:hypothetical protein
MPWDIMEFWGALMMHSGLIKMVEAV